VIPKTTGGRLGCVGLIVVLLGLCVGGLLLGGVVNEEVVMPVISLAAEKIHLPFALPLWGHDLPNTFPATWLAMLVLIVVALAFRPKEGKVPGRLQALLEMIFEGFYEFIEGVAGDKTRMFFPLIATFFFFILIANWMGLLPGVGSIGVYQEHEVPGAAAVEEVAHEGEEGHEADVAHEEHEKVLVPFLRGANADLNTTIALALISQVAAQYFGFRTQGLKYLSKFFTFKGKAIYERPINAIVGILELISEFIKVVSFSFRLFGNIFAGEVLLIVMAFLAAFIASLPFMGLELFVGLVQALIFSMLSLVFYLMATVSHDEHEGH
jgi:F-type H+-transporting ATPase subunit a